MAVDLYLCTRCDLLWVEKEPPTVCPSCKLRGIIPEQIVLAGREIDVRAVFEHGAGVQLLDKQVRHGLDKLQLGMCVHGWITSAICPECCNND